MTAGAVRTAGMPVLAVRGAMQSSRLQQLAARRHALTGQAHALRARLLAESVELRRSMRAPELAGSALRSLGRHPAVLVSGAVALILVGPRRVLRLAAGALGAWSLMTRASGVASVIWRLLRRA